MPQNKVNSPAASNSLSNARSDPIALKPTAPIFPVTKDASKSNPEGERRPRKEINYKEDAGNSTSSVEYPVVLRKAHR